VKYTTAMLQRKSLVETICHAIHIILFVNEVKIESSYCCTLIDVNNESAN